MESDPVTLAEDSGLFDSTPSEEGGALAAPSEADHEVAMFDSPAASEASSAEPSDEETGLFGAANTADAASESAPADAEHVTRAHTSARRPSGARRGAKADRGRFHTPAKLAAAVAKLRQHEDTIVDSVVAADQLIRRLESRGVHADAGYPSPSDFEYRIL